MKGFSGMIRKVKASALENYSKYLYQSQMSLSIIYCFFFFFHNSINVNSDVLTLRGLDDLEVGGLYFLSFYPLSQLCSVDITTSKDRGYLMWVNPYYSIGFILLTLPTRLIRRAPKGASELTFRDITFQGEKRKGMTIFVFLICLFANYIYFT